MLLIMAGISTITMSPSVYVSNGNLHIIGANSCTITINKDMDAMVTLSKLPIKYTYPNKAFGLIDYNCDGYSGSLISQFECKECGIYCSYNQYIEKCKNDWAIFGVSITMSSLIMIILIFIFRTKLINLISACIDQLIVTYHNKIVKKDYKEARKVMKVTDLTNVEIEDRVRSKYGVGVASKVAKTRNRYNEKLILLDNKNKNKGPEYVELSLIREEEDKAVSKTTDAEVHHSPNQSYLYPHLSRTNSTLSTAGAICAGLALTSFVQPSNGCDNNLFLNSMGQVCDMTTCKDIDMYTMPIQTGQSICFKDTDNNDLSIKIMESYILTRYIRLYYTSDWDIKTDSYYKCKGTDGCWNGDCNYDTIGETYGENMKIKSRNVSLLIDGYGCLTSALGCDTTCWHKLSCTFFKWTVTPKGPAYPVYKQENSLWETRLMISYKNITKTAILNVNNPSIGLTDFESLLGSNIPIYVTNFMSESPHQQPNLIVTNTGIIPVTAAELDMPEQDKVGDFQASLDMMTHSININSVDCKVESCKVKCFSPVPKVRKLDSLHRKNHDSSVTYLRNDGTGIILGKKRLMATVSVMIGNLKIKNLQVVPAMCTININTIYGCKGCTKLPKIIYSPMDVRVEGTLFFESNCTFDKTYFSCGNGPEILTLTALSDYCLIYIPKNNQTINIEVKYEFLGQVEPNSIASSTPTFSDELREAVSSVPFWQGIVSTFTLFTGISILMTIISRMFKIYEVRKINKQVNTN